MYIIYSKSPIFVCLPVMKSLHNLPLRVAMVHPSGICFILAGAMQISPRYWKSCSSRGIHHPQSKHGLGSTMCFCICVGFPQLILSLVFLSRPVRRFNFLRWLLGLIEHESKSFRYGFISTSGPSTYQEHKGRVIFYFPFRT